MTPLDDKNERLNVVEVTKIDLRLKYVDFLIRLPIVRRLRSRYANEWLDRLDRQALVRSDKIPDAEIKTMKFDVDVHCGTKLAYRGWCLPTDMSLRGNMRWQY